ncbi:hypothetical protein CGLO_11324 [Colletotrichum gloeosporioides Cg-14]|uniref:Uncharacterized protein n=1 Tax=Colletotrichum gloeosporioides (strain Cg-14) TaxID=1237896 RepID=T0LM53_COLGC|nr:hypothetical protein CGLO_11324 [Colletotrichum gloeosporioides Cg-14]
MVNGKLEAYRNRRREAEYEIKQYKNLGS